MDFHELEAFSALADTLHFARAASQVHLSPSALSRLLGRLEEEMGVLLLERDTRQVSLTREGAAFLAFARESLHRQQDLLLKLGERDDRLRGILRIYASVTACYSILPPLVEALAREHPDLRLSIETGDPSDAADAVREGRAELALDALPPSGFRQLECHSVRKTPLVFVSARSGAYGNVDLPLDRIREGGGHFADSLPAEELERKMIAVLSSVPVVLPKNGLSRDRFDRWTRTHGIKPLVAAETVGNEAVLALARLGLGLGLVPRLVLESGPFAEGLVLYEAGPDFGEYDLGFIQKPASSGPESARRMRTAIAELIRYTYR
ncbi:MAG TPA: LysR substrate-binding domain-containing protein [Treponemataceae bacterium]|jgi:LysR family positive regulator for ilvC|nr:LysR substrate-binding domain-containing protein [Treponemataceae bacterium]